MSDIENLTNQLNIVSNRLDKLVDCLLKTNEVVIPQPCKYTLYSFLDDWLINYKKPSVSVGTYNAYEVLIRLHIKSNIVDKPLNSYSSLDIQSYLTSKRNTRTRKAEFDLLKSVFKRAYNTGIISVNPMLAVDIKKHNQKKGKSLTDKEVKNFKQAIKGHKTETFFLFLLYTGCRRGEALDLKYSDIDFNKMLININGTKNEYAKRTIPLFTPLLGLLNKSNDKKIWTFRADYLTKVFKKFCPNHKLHDLRHTFATRCLQAEIPLKVVQTWLGHSKITTTADIYTHVTFDINKHETEKFNRYNEKMPF